MDTAVSEKIRKKKVASENKERSPKLLDENEYRDKSRPKGLAIYSNF